MAKGDSKIKFFFSTDAYMSGVLKWNARSHHLMNFNVGSILIAWQELETLIYRNEATGGVTFRWDAGLRRATIPPA